MSNSLSSMVKTRFCPSPTGLLHFGNIRTALFNVLFAKKESGIFLLRIEDTDQERSSSKYTEQLQQDLLWLGLSWQEGPGKEGEAEPYYQSQRQTIYDHYYQELQKMGRAYYCFCSEEELALARKLQRSAGKPPRYPGTCRNLTPSQVDEKLAKQLKPTLRFKVQEEEIITFRDIVKGDQTFKGGDIGDFIICRTDGTSPFLFCNAIDDALMKVTHILRGEDHLTNTPRQILILKALNLPIAEYGHIALIIGNDGSPLSKRHGSKSMVELREEGYLPAAINNYLARLGHYYGHDNFLGLEQLAEEFKTTNLSKAPAKFNLQQLNYWQKIAVDHLNIEEFENWLGKSVKEKVPETKWQAFMQIFRKNILFPAEALSWQAILFQDIIINPELFNSVEVHPEYFQCAISAYRTYGNNFVAILEAIKQQLQLKGKSLFQPLRLALTTLSHGPELDKLASLISEEEILKRLEQAQSVVSQCKTPN